MRIATATKSETCFVVAQALQLTLARQTPSLLLNPCHPHSLTSFAQLSLLLLLLLLPDLIAVELQFAPTEQSISVKSL